MGKVLNLEGDNSVIPAKLKLDQYQYGAYCIKTVLFILFFIIYHDINYIMSYIII